MWRVIMTAHFFMCLIAYPSMFPVAYVLPNKMRNTPENAIMWAKVSLAVAGGLGCVSHTGIAMYLRGNPSFGAHCFAHFIAFLALEYAWIWNFVISIIIVSIHKVERLNRLQQGKVHGKRVVVIGNGPSALREPALGELIDSFDEVVRFNNFQTKVAGYSKFVGSKCTVHFTDGMLAPTVAKYFVPGATVMLSLFMDRLLVGGSYIIFRMATESEWRLTYDFFMDPETYWMEHDHIQQVKRDLSIPSRSQAQPTSGMMAIDYFMRKEGVELPIYIHGFDFFEGDRIHYFNNKESVYERIIDWLGVRMHRPHLEKILVRRLVDEGKVRWLKDLHTEEQVKTS